MRGNAFGMLACTIILFVMIAIPLSKAAAEPTFEFGFKGGLGMGKLTGDDTGSFEGYFDIEGYEFEIKGDVDQYRMGFTGGVYFMVHVTDMFGVRLEALYAMKGGKGEISGVITDPVFGDVPFSAEPTFKLNYFEIPLLAVLTVPVGELAKINVVAGPSFAFNVTAKLALELSAMGYSSEETEDIDEFVKGTDVGALIGGGFEFDAGRVTVFIDGRWVFGFSTIDDTSNELDIKNSALSFAVGVGIPFGAIQ